MFYNRTRRNRSLSEIKTLYVKVWIYDHWLNKQNVLTKWGIHRGRRQCVQLLYKEISHFSNSKHRQIWSKIKQLSFSHMLTYKVRFCMVLQSDVILKRIGFGKKTVSQNYIWFIDTKGAFTPDMFGLFQLDHGPFSLKVRFVWRGENTHSNTGADQTTEPWSP